MRIKLNKTLMFLCTIIIPLAAIKNVENETTTLRIGAIFDKQNQKRQSLNAIIEEINGKSSDRGERRYEVIEIDMAADSPFEVMRATCALIEEGVVAIVGPSSVHNYKIVQSICDDKDIPLLMAHWSDDGEDYSSGGEPIIASVINLFPHQDELQAAYVDLLNAWRYENFVILYENNESLRQIEYLVQFYYNKEGRVVALELDRYGTGNYRPILKDLLKSPFRHFVIHCSIDILEEVLRQAQQTGLMTSEYHYFITNLDLHTLDLTPYQFCDANITGLRLVNPESDDVKRFATKFFQNEIKKDITFSLTAAWLIQTEVLLLRDSISMLVNTLEGLSDFSSSSIDCESDDRWIFGSTVINSMQNMEYGGLTGFIKFDLKGHRSNFNLDVMELREGGITAVGKWRKSHGINVTSVDRYGDRENKTLQNRNYRVVISLIEPFARLKDTSITLSGNEQYEGFAIDLIDELSKLEGFNYTFINQEDKKNGDIIDKNTGEWSGMVGKIMKDEAELAIGDLTITSDRQKAVDFVTPFMTTGVSILYHKATKATPGFFTFADPFALEVWELLAVSFFGVSITLYILGRISASEWTNPYPCIEEPEYFVNQLSFRNCIWFTTGSLMQQGTEIGPIAISTRMVACVWWFFTLIMVSSYTANLTAFLTSETPAPHFRNIFELVENADKFGISYGAKAQGSTKNFFRDSKIDVYRKINDYMEQNKETVLMDDPLKGVEKAEKENYAFFMEITSIEYEIQRRCNLTAVGDLLDEKSYGIAMKKNSTDRNIFNKAVSTLQQKGVIADLKRKWWVEKRGGGLCSGSDEPSEAQALNLKHVSGVFWVTIGGTLVASFMVFAELILHVTKETVKGKTSFVKAIVEEFKFYFKFSGTKKPVIRNQSSN